ncbi:unnamed protein product [Lactuca virosa]|uniref:Uncharacterized protein n=1 Tax=Lactuca virosa TaxID=75947 RepID=A0AAU9LQ92_9ASTR|nr:unnamed protein product [Lactuca virosa]
MEQEPEEDRTEDPEEMEQEPEEEMEIEAYESMGEVTPIEEERHVASPPPTSYYLGSGLTGNLHSYDAAPIEPTSNPVSEAPRAIQEMRMHDPAWITEVVNEWVRDQGGTHPFEVRRCSKA